MTNKGILLCGGSGSRLQPLTKKHFNKHLVPVNDKYMFEYPLQNLIDLGVTDLIVVTSSENCGLFAEIIGNGKQYGLKNVIYKVQTEPDGILGAIKLCKNELFDQLYITDKCGSFWVALGDNFIELDKELIEFSSQEYNDFILITKHVKQGADQLGIMKDFGIVEKPKGDIKGNAVVGLYKFPLMVFEEINKFVKSDRGEFEITDLNNHLLNINIGSKENPELLFPKEDCIYQMKDDCEWFDMGTIESLEKVRKLLKLKEIK